MFRKTLFSALIFSSILSGCSTAPQPYDNATMKDAADQAVVVRSIFDAAGGDLDKVSANDKKKLVERFKTEAAVREVFEKMKHPPGAGGSGSQLPAQAKSQGG